jgi:mRNA-degrading endonuclease toxin of MazEF toxin-antitoxin module
MNRGDIWLAHVGNKTRPVLVLTRSEVLDVRLLVTVAEITTQMRGLAVEVTFDSMAAGLEFPSVINCDGLHTIAQTTLTQQLGEADNETMTQVCHAISYALGC